MNNLTGIIYTSKATIDFDENDLYGLAFLAAKRNKNLDITGYLYFVKGSFMQYLEGDRTTVESVMTYIENDTRHEIISILKKQNLEHRKFPLWDMKYITKDMLTEIKMETLVIERMEYIRRIKEISKTQIGQSEKESSVWRMVDTISQLNRKFK